MKTYGPGKPVESMNAFNAALELGLLLWVSGWNRTVHPIVLANMQYRVIKGFIDHGQVFLAKKI